MLSTIAFLLIAIICTVFLYFYVVLPDGIIMSIQLVNISAFLLFMAALHSRCGHYIFVLWFLSSSSFFIPRLTSAVADWMSTILLHMVWP